MIDLSQWPHTLIFMAVLGAVLYLAYRQGIGVSKSIAAVLFVFQPGNTTDRATLNSCTGWVKHAGRFRESRAYEFVFDAQLSKGSVEVTLLDKKKQPIMTLNPQFPARTVYLDAKSRYDLRWEFRSATGTCTLRW